MGARSTKQWRVFDSNQWAAQDGNRKTTWRNLPFEILVTRTYVVSFESTSSAGSDQSTYTTFWHNHSISTNFNWVLTINSDPTHLISLYSIISLLLLLNLLLHPLSFLYLASFRIYINTFYISSLAWLWLCCFVAVLDGQRGRVWGCQGVNHTWLYARWQHFDFSHSTWMARFKRHW